MEKDVANAADRMVVNGDGFRLVKNAFACCFKEARLSTTGSSDIEHNKYVGQVSTMLRAWTIKDGNSVPRFDKIDESQAQIQNTLLKHLRISNHDLAAIKKRMKTHLPHEQISGFCKVYRQITKQIGFRNK